VRIGTAEIYAAVDRLPAVADSLVIGVEQPDGGYWMALFVTLEGDAALDDAGRTAIVEAIRRATSPRHVPDEIVQVRAIPRTTTGKKLEVPIKRLFMGADAATAVNRNAVADPAALDAFVELAAARSASVRH
jgi:acetoacetyl-CoA synthetase